jgi:membrane protease YdiL (CAAX protease family)
MKVKTKKVVVFLGFTFAVDWAMALLFSLLGGAGSRIAFMILGAAYMFVPMTGVIVTQKAICKDTWKNTLRLNFRINPWWIAAWLLPPALAGAAFGVALLLPGIGFSPDFSGLYERYRDLIPPSEYARIQAQLANMPVNPFWLGLLAGLAAGATVNAVAGYGEELGWRGFLFDELAPLGFWRTSLLTGLIWGVWHAPLILMGLNYPHYPLAGVPMMIAWCVLLAPLFGFVRLKSKSVPAAAIMHGTLNGTAGLAMLLVSGGNEFLVGLPGLAGFIVLLLVDLGIFAYLKLRPPAEARSARGDVPAAG